MSGRAATVQRAYLDLCAAVAVQGIDALALVGAAHRRLTRSRPAAPEHPTEPILRPCPAG